MQTYQSYILGGTVAALLFSSCDVREILPNDLSDPAHARYVASGAKDADRKEWWANILICQVLTQPVIDGLYQDCVSNPKNPVGNCGPYEVGGYAHTTLTLTCANEITSFGSGAKDQREFWDEFTDE